MSISSIGAGTQDSVTERLNAVRTANLPAPTGSDDKSPSNSSTTEKSVHVDLSPVARMMSGHGGNKTGAKGNADIDESSLPSAVKDLLKRIRELKEKLRELQQQMRQIQADASLSPEQRQAKAQQLQAQIQALTAALSTATSALGKAMKQQNLSPEQLTDVASFLSS